MNDTKVNGTGRGERTVSRVKLIAPLPRKKRVAAYARVSADKDASLHSLAAQSATTAAISNPERTGNTPACTRMKG